MPVFLHTLQRENSYAKLHENALFEMKNYKVFWGGALPPRPIPHRGGGHPLPGPHSPRHLRRLDARAFHGQLPRMSSDHRNARVTVRYCVGR